VVILPLPDGSHDLLVVVFGIVAAVVGPVTRSRSLAAWCRENGLSYRRGLELVKRGLPCLTISRRHHVDRAAAEIFLEREARREAGDVDLGAIVDGVVAAVRGERS
jgi:hypothetical protein